MLQGLVAMAPLMTVQAVAEWLAVGPSTVHRLCKAGHLRFVRIGTALRIDPTSVEAFITSAGSTLADS